MVEQNWRDGKYFLHDAYKPCSVHVSIALGMRNDQ